MEYPPSEFHIRVYGEEFTAYDPLAAFLADKHENFRRVFRIIPLANTLLTRIAGTYSIHLMWQQRSNQAEELQALFNIADANNCNQIGAMLLFRLRSESRPSLESSDDHETPMA
jgi:hypothetical protein